MDFEAASQLSRTRQPFLSGEIGADDSQNQLRDQLFLNRYFATFRNPQLHGFVTLTEVSQHTPRQTGRSSNLAFSEVDHESFADFEITRGTGQSRRNLRGRVDGFRDVLYTAGNAARLRTRCRCPSVSSL